MRARDVLPAVAAGAFAVICCAGLPAVLALVGGATALGLLGGGGSVALLAGGAGAFVVRARRRRACAVPPSRPRSRA
jgi:hypothetical protein